jgi:hypothetical protein
MLPPKETSIQCAIVTIEFLGYKHNGRDLVDSLTQAAEDLWCPGDNPRPIGKAAEQLLAAQGTLFLGEYDAMNVDTRPQLAGDDDALEREYER